MARKPLIVRTLVPLRKAIAALRKKRGTIALIPTMGALHDGHFSLVQRARKQAGAVVVSIFVNPKQFAPTEDFGSYPRNFERDVAALSKLGVDLIWAPTGAVMYPEGFSTSVAPGGPARAGLEDAFRPHFFGGVTTVVAKLFLQVAPDYAMFGQKDYQQLKVVTRMARDLDLPVRVIGCATMRENDGLALSSRNVYLSPRRTADRAGAVPRAEGMRGPDQGRRGDRGRARGWPCRRLAGRFHRRLFGGAPCRDAGTGCGSRRRSDPPAGRGKARQDAADRQSRGVGSVLPSPSCPARAGHPEMISRYCVPWIARLRGR
jgi:pantoate--beta-alanine ligase